MSPVPMITRVRLKNYRSIAECDVQLGPLTILVGPNGSGKSNFLRALYLISDALNNGLDAAIRAEGGMRSVLSRWAVDAPNGTFSIELDLNLAEHRRGMYRLEIGQRSSGEHRISHEQYAVWDRMAGTKLAEFLNRDGSVTGVGPGEAFERASADPLRGRSLMLAHAAGQQELSLIYDALRGMAFYSLHVGEMRKVQEPDTGDQLQKNGANLASVLQRMAPENDRGWSPLDVVRDTLDVITPGVEAIETSTIQNHPVFEVRQRLGKDEPAYRFSPGELSYGTLRSLGVLAALYQGSMKGGSPVTLVGIEEPESAVHPASAVALLEAMDETSLTTQVLATTHSTAMLDRDDLDLKLIRAVCIRNGRTVIGPVDAASRRTLEEHLYTGGELLRMGHLGPDESTPGLTHETPVPSSR